MFRSALETLIKYDRRKGILEFGAEIIWILDLGWTKGSVKTKAGRGDKAIKGRSERMTGPKMVQ